MNYFQHDIVKSLNHVHLLMIDSCGHADISQK